MTTPRTIAVDLTPVLPGGENGGAKIFVIELVRRLAAQLPQSRFVLLTQAASHDELAALDSANVERHLAVGEAVAQTWRPRLLAFGGAVLRRSPGFLRGLIGRLGYSVNRLLKRSGSVSMLRKLEADLLFCPFTAPTYHEQGVPTVCTLYDLQFEAYPEFFTPEDVAHRRRSFEDACKRASALAAISDYTRSVALRHASIPEARIRTIHLRLAARSAASQADAGVLARLKLARGRYALYPANFWRHKNHEMLLAAFGMAVRRGLARDVMLVCTGAPGARQARLAADARAMGLGARVLLPGYLGDAELAGVLNGAGGLVFPSLYEGFGLPVLEAMAAGVPVACSNTSSLPEVAAGAAAMFDPRVPGQMAEAICALFGDAALRGRLIGAGRQRAQAFMHAERMVTDYIELFEFAVAQQRRGDGLSGLAPDGWIGARLQVEVAAAAGEQAVELDIAVPGWFPQAAVTVHASERGGQRREQVLALGKGQDGRARFTVAADGGLVDFEFEPTATPASQGVTADPRPLSARLTGCRIVRAAGTAVLYAGSSA